MLYVTVPMMLWMGAWIAVSLRSGAVVITTYRYFEVVDSGYFPREGCPIHFWTAIAAMGALGVLCLGLSIASIVMGIAW